MNDIQFRNNVKILGNYQGPTLILAHGFGCDQNMWRFMVPALQDSYKLVLFDYVGSGQSQLTDFSIEKYASLEGYAQDICDILVEYDLHDVTIVGHSVSATIAAIVSLRHPDLIKRIIMVCPSPCFFNDPPAYGGGFERGDLEELLGLMDKNYIGWANYLAPLVMGSTTSEALIGELSGSFCSTDPLVAKTFAKATFFSDYRDILPLLSAQTLILQSRSDNLAGVHIGSYMHEQISNSQLHIVEAQGHCLHITHYADIVPLILDFIETTE